uniref:F1F0-ATP synthase delta subunit C-terminal domain-containing protein n=1 Tax=Anas platyrhynchos platyrhynchos TaxID=8840 RepID=A0A493T5W8_ANAPP
KRSEKAFGVTGPSVALLPAPTLPSQNFPCFPPPLINTRLTPPWGWGKVTGWASRFYSGKGSSGLPGVSFPELPRVLTPLAAPPLTPLCLAVSSGSVTVNADSTVQVLAEEAVTMDMLDLATAKSNLEKAISEVAAASDEAAKAEAQIKVEANEALVKALE